MIGVFGPIAAIIPRTVQVESYRMTGFVAKLAADRRQIC
jgi:hypothetical protein